MKKPKEKTYREKIRVGLLERESLNKRNLLFNSFVKYLSYQIISRFDHLTLIQKVIDFV